MREKREVPFGPFLSSTMMIRQKLFALRARKKSHGGSNPKSFNTSNLRKHLEGHKDKFQEYVAQEKKKQELQSGGSKASFKQVTLESLSEKRKLYAPDHPRAKGITHRIAEMIAVDLQPFSVVEDVGFCRLMAELEPRYVLPSQRYFSEVIIPGIHASVKYHISELLKSTDYVSVTTDIWSSTHSHHSFMSLTAHFILSSSMEKKHVMLSARKV